MSNTNAKPEGNTIKVYPVEVNQGLVPNSSLFVAYRLTANDKTSRSNNAKMTMTMKHPPERAGFGRPSKFPTVVVVVGGTLACGHVKMPLQGTRVSIVLFIAGTIMDALRNGVEV